MINVTIPGWKELKLTNLVLDFNGTIAVDGKLLGRIIPRIEQLCGILDVYVITADTHGSVKKQCENLNVSVHVVSKDNQQLEKQQFIEELKGEGTVTIGNGNIDIAMFAAADLAIGVIEGEGLATRALLESDLVVTSIDDALDLLLYEERLIATLRQ